MAEITFQTTVKGGLPVLVTCRLYEAEPDVGAAESAEIDDICWLSGKTVSNAVWRSIPQSDFDRIELEALEGQRDHLNDYADYLYEMRRDRQLEESA